MRITGFELLELKIQVILWFITQIKRTKYKVTFHKSIKI